MTAPETILTQFNGFAFGAPCNEPDIIEAERRLGTSLPEELRMFYRCFDGFRGPTEANFLWPLRGRDGLVGVNRFLREGAEFPHAFVSSCVFFGDAGIGDMWGLMLGRPGQVVRWSASWGEDFEVAGTSPLDVWLKEKRFYDEQRRRGDHGLAKEGKR